MFKFNFIYNNVKVVSHTLQPFNITEKLLEFYIKKQTFNINVIKATNVEKTIFVAFAVREGIEIIPFNCIIRVLKGYNAYLF